MAEPRELTKTKRVGLLHADGWAQMAQRRSAPPRPATDQAINFMPGMSLETLIQGARDIYGDSVADPSASTLPYVPPNAPIAAVRWLKKVWPRGDWDYKLKSPGTDHYEGLGNYAYGATGAVIGIPDPVLMRGAGLAQEVFHLKKDGDGRRPGYDPAWGHFWQGGSHGDDPRDQASIRRGIEDAKAALAAERASLSQGRRR